MTLPVSGQIKMTQVNAELSRPQSQTASLGETPVRELAGEGIGTISMSDLHGKRVIPKTLTGPSTAAGNNEEVVTYRVTSNPNEAVTVKIQWAQNPPTVYNLVTDAFGDASFTHSYFYWATWVVTAYFVDGTTKTMNTFVNSTTTPIDTTKRFRVYVPSTWNVDSPNLFSYRYEGAGSINLQSGTVAARDVNTGAPIISSNGNHAANIDWRGEGEVQLILVDNGYGYIAMELRFYNAAGEYITSELRTVTIISSTVSPPPTTPTTPPPLVLDGSASELQNSPIDAPPGYIKLRITNFANGSYTWSATPNSGGAPNFGSGSTSGSGTYHDFDVPLGNQGSQSLTLVLNGTRVLYRTI